MSVDARSTIADLARSYASGAVSPVEVVADTLKRIGALDDRLFSYLEVRADEAMADARRLEAELREGRTRGPLHGVPIGLKDLIDVAGMHTTGGSVLMRENRPSADAEMVTRLKAAGAVIIGKNNLYEFGLGLPTDGEWPQAAKNPWDLARIPGGSSSGSAVSVAAGLSHGSFGTDTGGSIRGPASYCGVVGMKPTYGLIPTNGCMTLSWTLDHIGPMARTVDDAAALLAGASGTAIDLAEGIDGLRIGVPQSLIDRVGLEADLGRAFDDAVVVLERCGAKVTAVELPDLDVTEASLMTLVGTEGLAVHLPTLGPRPEAYGRSARERLSGGLIHSGVDYVNALRARDGAIEALEALFGDVDVLVSPVTLQVAPTNADFQRSPPHRTPFTGLYNLTGGAAVSVPAGFDGDGMPIGLQLAGPFGSDARVLTVARAYERETAWHTRIPTFPESVASS